MPELSEYRDAVAEVLAAHARKVVREPVPNLDIHCECGWTHPDRFVANPDIHRAHLANALLASPAIARIVADARTAALQEAADLIASKDRRTDLGDDEHSTGWRHALNEAEHDLRQLAETFASDCTCGYDGGYHEPLAAHCERNRAATESDPR